MCISVSFVSEVTITGKRIFFWLAGDWWICFQPSALFFRSPALFSNQVAMFFSDAEEERVRKELKAIEQSAGRRPEDKKEEKVSLDIDLLSYDDRILRPEDLKREYIVKGLEELKYNQI